MGTISWAQSKEQKRIVEEGKKLYRSEMASWYGTDVFLDKFKDKSTRAGGYFSYATEHQTICVFFSQDAAPKILATFAFDSTFSVNTVMIDGQERALSKQESDLLAIRQIALAKLGTDTLFKFYQDMNPNIIPLNDALGKRVYVLTGPKKVGVVVFGNDYLLTFDDKNELRNTKRLHHNLIRTDYGKPGEVAVSAMHTHVPETGDLITATDICTLMLYAKFARWRTYYVLSQKNVSIWDCEKDQLIVMTKEAFEKIGKSETKP
ncbi:hypothetical protein D4L85_19745 [Chryseolinea soli]|uniref:Uncharacterized protein n=2 Tax=Chryseolinea soli TaxID=2321403 RepID=A0A385SQW2_9BACT|nr:hypothetical protein D4L85_19745 [Chryseolinea soli]